MAELIEPQASDEGMSDLPADTEAMSPEQVAAAMDPVSTTNQQDLTPVGGDDELPEKYRGKDIKDIIGMHQEAEKVLGRQGSEVGELRAVVDTFIKSQLEGRQKPEPEPEPVDFFEDPAKAVSQAIESHPAVQRAQSDAEHSRQASNLERIKAKHPDMQEVVGSQTFMEWVQASPIRTEIYQRADQNFDFEAADELITTFKERKGMAAQATQVEQEARQQQVKAAQTGGGSGANTSGSKRIYRRADIIQLMKTDPDRYDALSPEILQAYAEGRVR